MALRWKNNRGRSTSNILDEMVIDKEKFEENPFSENRFKTYSCKMFEEKKKYFAEERKEQKCDSKEKKEPCVQKSNNFVKKLIASLEKKNEACKADDEFFTKYYRKNDYSNPNSDYSCDSRVQSLNKMETRKEFGKNCGKLENFQPKVTSLANTQTNKQFLEKNCSRKDNLREPEVRNSNKVENTRKIRNRHFLEPYLTDKFFENSLKLSCDTDPRKDFSIDEVERNEREFGDGSSFHPHRSRVEFQNKRDFLDSYVPRKTKDRETNTLNRIFMNSTEEESNVSGHSRRKLSRKKSFKNFFGSIVKWKRSENKREKPRRFLSCDRLSDGGSFELLGNNGNKLSRATSLQAVVFENYGREISMQTEERKATIRPVYGGKRNERCMEPCARNKENRKYFETTGSTENLAKPSAIKDIAKCFTEHPKISLKCEQD